MSYHIPYMYYPTKEMSSVKSISFFLLVIGLIFMTIGYVKNTQTNTKPIIEYRYIPQSFEQEQNKPDDVNMLFSNMFEKRDPWTANKFYVEKNYNEEIDNSPTYRPIVQTGTSIKQSTL